GGPGRGQARERRGLPPRALARVQAGRAGPGEQVHHVGAAPVAQPPARLGHSDRSFRWASTGSPSRAVSGGPAPARLARPAAPRSGGAATARSGASATGRTGRPTGPRSGGAATARSGGGAIAPSRRRPAPSRPPRP